MSAGEIEPATRELPQDASEEVAAEVAQPSTQAESKKGSTSPHSSWNVTRAGAESWHPSPRANKKIQSNKTGQATKETMLEQELGELNEKLSDRQGVNVGSPSRDGPRVSIDFEALQTRMVQDDPMYSSPSARSIGSASTAASMSPGEVGSKRTIQKVRKTLATTQGLLKKYQGTPTTTSAAESTAPASKGEASQKVTAAGYPKPAAGTGSVGRKGLGNFNGAKRSSSLEQKFPSAIQDSADWLTTFHNATGYSHDTETRAAHAKATRPIKAYHFDASERCCQKQLKIQTPSFGQDNQYRNYILQYATNRCVAGFPSPSETTPSSQGVRGFKSVLDGSGWQKIMTQS
jgi:hypothetical protein